ncbi:CBS domain-containing protein [Cyanobacterium aponinum UTEX 3222]|uniref:CBS domain-containing protein n=3 Tax=Cyanobacterium aponinum TaxID=379064 RepID=A0A844GZY3_9CHRO|nr:CBS domain-containing protein [Cyanobacterium aponinum]WRL43816.1 CBS domain-containing protein [Cyanobacterium aponinum UTEX 3222]AFZ54226.1 putative signal transduction protein with CBS domains [Cyanobacterium aponinum PCC 10605]MBD2393833.1 CBS domain-containing protein [Cyanobacterium aponinum FACHB-4101]MTF40349.1 CBS domain-containing protein [Cyanobacterium aponinum 0216]PHV64256.1 CBS domain-containing protein [Cyanobacterium aponinum IPPAS B-1201]
MNKTVGEVMTPNPITVKPETPLKEAIALLVEHKISGMPVIKEGGELVGILSESDLMWQETGVEPPPYIMILDSIIYLQNPNRYDKEIHKALGQTVADVMSDKPITISSTKTIKEAAQLLHQKQIRRLPVVDSDKKIIGILTQGDIIRAMADE